MRSIDKIIVHCSDSPHGRGDDVETIRRWHVEGNGWSDIGYHFVILEDGTVQAGRPIEKMGAHVRGHNRNSIGVCMIGIDYFTIDQMASLDGLLSDLCEVYDIKGVYGHRDFDSSKTCPNFNVAVFGYGRGEEC